MSVSKSMVVCLLVAVAINGALGQITGIGTSTRGWDCCKPTCSWFANTHNLLTGPVRSCDALGNPLLDFDDRSGCDAGGSAYMCLDQQPFVSLLNPLVAYGYAAANIPGLSMRDTCCSCWLLTFPEEARLLNRQMVVQITNSGDYLAPGQFNLLMPGGGLGPHTLGCSSQFADLVNPLRAVTRPTGCGLLPNLLEPGCDFMFSWFRNARNPIVEYTRVQCPRALVARTGCLRADEDIFRRFRVERALEMMG